ncbi:MAG: S1 RNA-binding domain-containing protein [Caldilineales bacterium]|nr:S1 RNA-binding domain-containing protein [Caldilineales bacterium]MDW8318339.1 S1 RNA-binding domain-containing protein [Anaerolineae bacterium]
MTSLRQPAPWAFRPVSGDGAEGSSRQDDDEQDWIEAERHLQQRIVCDLPVIGYNRGGLLVRFGRINAFVPSSHLKGFPVYADFRERELALERRVGQVSRFVVIEIDREHRRLILSERAASESRNPEQILARLKPGDVVTGRVSNLRRFGAFVDLGGFEGLIHISEMSWGRVNHPGEVIQPGDEVRVYILDVNMAERKVQLSLKRLQPDPWANVLDRYQVGQRVRGEVTNVVSFGAFVRLEDGVEGLIHISELAEGNFLHPRNVVREGQWVEARVLNIDPANRRIGLSLRQVRAGASRRDGRSEAFIFERRAGAQRPDSAR